MADYLVSGPDGGVVFTEAEMRVLLGTAMKALQARRESHGCTKTECAVMDNIVKFRRKHATRVI